MGTDAPLQPKETPRITDSQMPTHHNLTGDDVNSSANYEYSHRHQKPDQMKTYTINKIDVYNENNTRQYVSEYHDNVAGGNSASPNKSIIS